MDIFTIPLTNVPQRFEIELDNRAYIFVSRWNVEMDTWIIDVYDAITQAPIIMALPLVTGLDLLSQFRHLMTGSLVVTTDGREYSVPTIDNLGVESNVYFLR